MRRHLGFKLYEPGLLLNEFVRFAEQEGASFITQALVLRWATQPRGCLPAHWAKRLGVIRQFAQYQSAADPRTEIPPQELIPYQYRRKTPYIYSKKEILQFLDAAKRLPSATGLRALTYRTLFGLLAVTGMRVGEAVHLDREDVDLREGLLTIRQTKYGRPRWIPVHPSTLRALRAYARRRDQVCSKPKVPRFFLSESGGRLTVNGAEWTFRSLSHQIGLRGPADRYGPRIHDIRHTFAVRTLQGWYQAGMNVEQHLPKLATYIGHVHVNDTYWYLTGTPELMRWAVKRIDSAKGGSPS
jgi:integrase